MTCSRSILIFSLGVLAVSVALSGCNSDSVADLCTKGIPAFREKTAQALVAIQALPPRNKEALVQGRELASEDELQLPYTGSLTVDEQEYWKDWSTDRLNEVQKYIDLAEERPEWAKFRQSLHQSANGLVHLFSLAEAGDVEKMKTRLIQMDLRVREMQKTFCSEI